MSSSAQAGGYVVPSYRAPDDTAWYHFLHGNVPGHQIDFMYRPEVPQGALSRQHFSHLARLMKYIEPKTDGSYAFAIGNLSRDDTQYEPGHGGVALIFGLRIRGVTDHAGRQDPPFAHGIAAIDRELDYTTILRASLAFSRHVIGAAESAEWYRTYVNCAEVSPADVEHILAGYVSTFSDLPRPTASKLGPKWITGGASQPKRIVISHPPDTPFERLADCAARLTAMLYRSDIRWTSISNGREADVPNGVSIRFFTEDSVGPNDAPDGVRRLDEVSEDEAEIAEQMFGASPAEKKAERVMGWRERFGADASGAAASEPAPAAPAQTEGQRPSWEGKAQKPPYVPLEQPSAGDEVTTLWDGRSEKPPAPDGGDIDIPIDVSGDEPAPAGAVASGGSVQGSEAMAQPAPAAAMPGNGAGTHSATADLRPAAVEYRPPLPTPVPVTPAPVTPAPMTPTPAPAAPVPVAPVVDASAAAVPGAAVPLKMITTTLVMEAPAKAATEAPAVPTPRPVSPADEWVPSPNFRRPQAPMLRWTLMAMAAAGLVLAILYLVFADEPQSTPVTPGASSADPTPSAQPTEPATSEAVKPQVTATSPAPPSAISSSKAPVKSDKPLKGTNKTKSKVPYDAPLELNK